MNRTFSPVDHSMGLTVFRSLVVALGLLCSAPVLSQTSMPLPPERIQTDANGVDVVSGQIVTSNTHLSIGPAEFGLTLTNQLSGGAWSDSLSGMLEVTRHGLLNTEVTNKASWGNQAYVFASNGWRSGVYAELAETIPNTEYKLALGDGTVVTYTQLVAPYYTCGTSEPCSQFFYPVKVEKPNGLIILVHYATWTGTTHWQVRIQSVTNNAGYQIKFNYSSNTASDASWGLWTIRVSAVAINNAVDYCDPTANSCSFSQAWPTAYYTRSFTATQTVTTVTDPLGRTTSYTIVPPPPGGGPAYFKIKTPGSTVDNIVYTRVPYDPLLFDPMARRVTSVVSSGRTWAYATSNNASVYTARDPLNKPTVYTSTNYEPWSSMRLLVSIKNPLNQTVTFDYQCRDSPAYLGFTSTSAYDVTLPEGNSFTAACDGRGNIISRTRVPKVGSGLTNVSESWAYPANCLSPRTCNKPLTYVDGRGAQTDYAYDSAHGGLLSETRPAVNGVRPKKNYDYAQKPAYVKNASGTLVAASGLIWIPTKIRQCRTTSSCVGGADETVATYEYSATAIVNALLPKGKVVTTGGVSLRTCYSHDSYGNRISETTPRAGLSECP